jgi:hypothetical protein
LQGAYKIFLENGLRFATEERSMNTASPPIPDFHLPAADRDLAEQIRPGYGIPSQDPRPEAQFDLSSEEAEREAASALVGGGLVAGAAAGAVLGAATGEPVGVVVGGTLGAVAGALGGAATGRWGKPRTRPPAKWSDSDEPLTTR